MGTILEVHKEYSETSPIECVIFFPGGIESLMGKWLGFIPMYIRCKKRVEARYADRKIIGPILARDDSTFNFVIGRHEFFLDRV